jgi:hypothetical protein
MPKNRYIPLNKPYIVTVRPTSSVCGPDRRLERVGGILIKFNAHWNASEALKRYGKAVFYEHLGMSWSRLECVSSISMGNSAMSWRSVTFAAFYIKRRTDIRSSFPLSPTRLQILLTLSVEISTDTASCVAWATTANRKMYL